MNDEDLLLAECRSLALANMPELAESPLYVLWKSELAPELRQRTDCLGWASRGLPTIGYADAIGDRWDGPGNVVVLDRETILEVTEPGQVVSVTKNVMLHEVAHLFPAQPEWMSSLSNMPLAPGIEAMRQKVAKGLEFEEEPGGESDMHNAQFVRRAVHLFFRASIRGENIPYDWLFGAYYSRHAFVNYLPTLLSECHRMRDQPFAEIAMLPLPGDFVAQWEHDLEIHKHNSLWIELKKQEGVENVSS